MQNHWVINASYYCLRGKVGGQVLVMNAGAYVIAHFNEQTSAVVWQRVIPATDRKSIEEWLIRHFPANAVAPRQPRQSTAASA